MKFLLTLALILATTACGSVTAMHDVHVTTIQTDGNEYASIDHTTLTIWDEAKVIDSVHVQPGAALVAFTGSMVYWTKSKSLFVYDLIQRNVEKIRTEGDATPASTNSFGLDGVLYMLATMQPSSDLATLIRYLPAPESPAAT